MMRYVCICFVLCVAVLPQLTAAQGTSEFNIRVFGATDTIPPTTPASVSVTPVATDQINVNWATSTDNYLVFGYVVLRDGVVIATTTATSYIDTPLSASTTYAYQIAAFDGVPNYSTTTAAVATTTLPIITPPPPEEQVEEDTTTTGTYSRPVLESIRVQEGVATATLLVVTSRPSKLEVRFGTTPSYELGFVVGNAFRTNHDVRLYDLSPNTTYYYEIIAYAPVGGQAVIDSGSFRTLDDRPPVPPANVANLRARVEGETVELRYDLPTTFPIGGIVRVVRSHFLYPQSINDGVVVYEGTATRVFDVYPFTYSDSAYYTVFVLDPQGLVSSGAITSAVRSQSGVGDTTELPQVEVPIIRPETPDTTSSSTNNVSSTTDPAVPLGMPTLTDIRVIQATDTQTFADPLITLLSDTNFQVEIPSIAITGEYQTIVASLSNPADATEVFSFLLRLTSDQSTYSAVIAPVRQLGTSTLAVEVFDYEARKVVRYETTVVFIKNPNAPLLDWRGPWYWYTQMGMWSVLAATPFIVLWWLFIVFRRRDREDNAGL